LPEGIRPGGLLLTEHLIELCDFKRGDRILDAGCGTGTSLDFMCRKKRYETTGIDLSDFMLKKGLEKFPDLHLVQGNAMHLPFSDNSFDGVIAECSLSIMGDIRKVLGEIKRVLVTGGKFAISDIYIRYPEQPGAINYLLSAGCISGAFIQDEFINIVNNSGFNILLWEDHSKLWREFIAGLILNGISICDILTCSSSKEKEMEVLISSAAKVKPGYFSLIAENIL